MLYLPRGIYRFLNNLAYEKNLNVGNFLIQICKEYAISQGFECNHPSAFVVTDKAATKEANANLEDKFKKKTVKRCTNCGERWEA